MTNVKVDRKTVYATDEIDSMIRRADDLDNFYFKIRAKALVAIFARTGKRRLEVATVERDDVKVRGGNVSITFMVVKKRKKTVFAKRREKQIPLMDDYAKYILRYSEWMNTHHSYCKYFFPSVKSVFGTGLSFYEDKHLSGRQILRIIKQLNPRGWCHLFRETAGAEIVRADPSIIGVFKVQRRLDLEATQTAWRYVQRYAVDVIEHED